MEPLSPHLLSVPVIPESSANSRKMSFCQIRRDQVQSVWEVPLWLGGTAWLLLSPGLASGPQRRLEKQNWGRRARGEPLSGPLPSFPAPLPRPGLSSAQRACGTLRKAQELSKDTARHLPPSSCLRLSHGHADSPTHTPQKKDPLPRGVNEHPGLQGRTRSLTAPRTGIGRQYSKGSRTQTAGLGPKAP